MKWRKLILLTGLMFLAGAAGQTMTEAAETENLSSIETETEELSSVEAETEKPGEAEAEGDSQDNAKTETGAASAGNFDEAALQADARAVADALIKGDFQAVVDRFDATMAAQITADALKTGWESAVNLIGAYQEEVSLESAKAQDYYIVAVTERYEKNGMLIRIVYDTEGKIAGLQCTYADVEMETEQESEEGNSGWTEVELTVTADPDLPLGATLTLPNDVEKPPVVILVQGSGCTDRDENINGNKPFADIANGLAEQGIAVLRYDKRYFENPEAAPELADITLRLETLDDVSAAIELMEQDERVDGSQVYVLGHSLGGVLAPAIAAEHPELAGVISMAGSLRPLWEITYDQNMEVAEAQKALDLTEEQKMVLEEQLAGVEKDYATLEGDFSSLDNGEILMGIPVGYWKSIKEYNGMNFINDVTMPMLILQGGADFQVYPDKDYPLWQETIGDRDNVTFHLYDGLNHLMMPTQGKRDTSEYSVKSHVDQQVIDDVADFILDM